MSKRRQKIRIFILILSLILFPITIYYHSPYLTVDGIINHVLAGSAILFIGLFLSGVLFGRAWCGWLCIGGGIDEICCKAQPKPSPAGKANWIKWFLWIPWITAIIILIALKGIHTVEPTYQTQHGISLHDTHSYVIYYSVMSLFIIPALLIGRRAFCRYICWMAPFLILGRKLRNLLKLPALSLRPRASECIKCNKCQKSCPMNLPVCSMVTENHMENPDCLLCGMCVDTCPKSAIGFAFMSPKVNREDPH